MDGHSQKPIILFYNPQCAKPGYQRLPAAILQVASMIEGCYPYEIIDGNLQQETDPAARIVSRVQAGSVRYLAISIMPGPQLKSTVRDLRIIKKACPGLIVIVGGYFPLIHTRVCARDPDIDYVIAGPGEEAFKALVIALETGEPLRDIRGLAYWREDRLIRTAPASPANPEYLPEYPYHKLNMEEYIVPTFLGTRTLNHHSSFGCPFSCNFCGVVKLAHGKWFAQSGERLGALVQYMADNWKVNALEFHDNNFFVSEKRVESFCDQLVKRRLNIQWWGEGRVDTMLDFKEKTWMKMRKAGLKMVFLGAESGDDAALAMMNKGGSLSSGSTLQLAKIMKDHGIIPEFSFILGNPPKPLENITQTIQFIRRLKKINPMAEIILYRYDPVPLDGVLYNGVTQMGFRFPETLEEWTRPDWEKIQQRKSARLPWLSTEDQKHISDFQTVLNAYYPTATARHIKKGSWRYYLLKFASGIRYHFRWYKAPVELRWLQTKLSYQRPEISGF